ncbi:CopG family ribbon-helix-helix protein [Labrys monachus]|uniref:Transcriptional regulator n=1 Tax=Labrys monachus TaxID=217067 RepID=A0ABU0FQH8_9HYPH|nr:ribbon-helix-helix protein, CopG family [Labrys monachus]MDQ0396359.1 putative transcriptional regulator [Labrys monachus]
MPTLPFSLRLDPSVRERLDREARRLDRSSSWLATRAIEIFLDARDAKRRAIEAAVAEAENGEFISSEAMGRWMDSWDTDHELPAPEVDIHPHRS